ncbi:alpha/beta fold hydrolase [Maribacter hydrothermalis]|uniref:Alpha/beta hydrolase n=1 Tax=Maribacter hydrothermalis TaxID=1836467 RepID=A0A1B7Z858_9FLAO|nr:alpha/beta fold hydrolase [Maribacter hydrothermalis]APQ15851.1 alpha/beta hydrolase [Maribacter hydrothermalis]OBR38770.1 alpha/beta hydrolase [Maribacter hydrothermalis]
MYQKICYFSLFLLVITHTIYSQVGNFESFDGVHIAYIDEGVGEPALLLHGFLNSKKSWDKTVLKKDLLDAGYRVIIPDLRGNGDSDKPQEDKAYQNNAEVKDLRLLMDYLNIKKYKAIGYSRGSIVLAKLLTEDNRIEEAVLGGMGIDFTNPQWNRRIMFAKAFDGEVNEITKGAVAYAKSINADMRSLHLQQKYQPVTTVKELGQLEINVLVICGDEDSDNGNATELMHVFKNGSLVNVPGDHNGTYKTSNFSTEILKFLN